MNIVLGRKYSIIDSSGGAFREGQVVTHTGEKDGYGCYLFKSETGLHQWYKPYQVKPVVTQMVNK